MNSGMLTPEKVVEAVIRAGKVKGERSASTLVVLGILAGSLIAFAAYASTMASYNLLANPDTYGIGRCLLGAIFSMGLVMVVITGAELFTGNSLMTLAVIEKKISIRKLLRNWVIVYFANFAGAVLIAWLVAQTGLLGSSDGALGEMTVSIALGKVNLSFWKAFCSGILCNFLVCMAVWMAFATDSLGGKVAAIFGPIWLFATSGFEHSVANMYYIPAGIIAKNQYGMTGAFFDSELIQLNWVGFISNNLAPVTLGNLVGGIVCVGMAYWFAYYRKKRDSEKQGS